MSTKPFKVTDSFTTWGPHAGGCGHTQSLASARRCLAREQAYSTTDRHMVFDREIYVYKGKLPSDSVPPGRRYEETDLS